MIQHTDPRPQEQGCCHGMYEFCLGKHRAQPDLPRRPAWQIILGSKAPERAQTSGSVSQLSWAVAFAAVSNAAALSYLA